MGLGSEGGIDSGDFNAEEFQDIGGKPVAVDVVAVSAIAHQ
jgi:hypothetical protein